MGATLLRQCRAARVVAVFDEVARFVGPTGAQVHAEHRLDTDGA
jgi:hypothetical protein